MTDENARLLMKFIADLSVRMEAFRLVLRAHGVTEEEFALAEAELKSRWNSKADALVERTKERRDAERLRQLLESAEGTEQ